jgi:hypothetical protein
MVWSQESTGQAKTLLRAWSPIEASVEDTLLSLTENDHVARLLLMNTRVNSPLSVVYDKLMRRFCA